MVMFPMRCTTLAKSTLTVGIMKKPLATIQKLTIWQIRLTEKRRWHGQCLDWQMLI